MITFASVLDFPEHVLTIKSQVLTDGFVLFFGLKEGDGFLCSLRGHEMLFCVVIEEECL